MPEKDKHIDPLPPIDHSLVKYHQFEKNFYEEHEDISALSNIQSIDLQQKINIKVISEQKKITIFNSSSIQSMIRIKIRGWKKYGYYILIKYCNSS